MQNTQDVEGFDEPTKKFKLPKWALSLVVIIALLFGLSLIIPMFLDQSRYKDQIIQKIADASGYTVSWEGDVALALVPVPHATIEKAVISNGTQKILSVDEASVSVALMPLLQKRIEVKSVTLKKPDITLIVDVNGRQTWMSDKINEKKDDATSEESSSDKSSQDISIESVHIKDGSVLYRDESKKSEQVVTDLNLDVDADSLKGPFNLDGGLTYQNYKLKAKADAGKLGGSETTIKAEISIPENDSKVVFDGVYASETNSAKGNVEVSVYSIEDAMLALTKKKPEFPPELKGKLNLSGNIDYNPEAVNLKDLKVKAGDLQYAGTIGVQNLSTQPLVALDLRSTSSIQKPSSLPIKILSELQVKGGGSYVDQQLNLQPTILSFDGQVINVSGTYKTPSKGGRPLVNMAFKANELDIDDLQQQLGQKPKQESKSENGKAAEAKGISLPFDGNLKGEVASLKLSGKTYSNVVFDVVNNGPNLKINQFAAGLPAGSSVAVNGQVANLPELSGLNLNVAAKTSDVENLMKAYNAPPLNVGQTIGAGALNGKFSGSLDNLGFDATVNALQFAAKGAGTVQTPLSQPIIKSLNLNIKHPSLQSAIRNFSPGFEAPGSFNGPLDLSTNVTWDSQQYHLADIRGNLGSTTVGGDLKLALGAAKPDLSGNLSFGKLVFDSVAPESQGGTPSSKAPSGEGRWSREAIDASWMNKANADLSIKVATLQSGLWLLSNANLAFKLSNGTLNVSDMSAGLFGGTVAANGSMKSTGERAPITMNWSANAKNLNGQNLFSALRNKNSDTLTGTIQSFNVDVKAQGISPAALVQSLSGSGGAKANNIIIKGIDAAKLAEAASGSFKPLERAGTLFGSFQNGQTSFTSFDLAFAITGGIVNFTTSKFDGPQASLETTGNVNLPRWYVDLKNKMTVKNTDVPPFEFAVNGPLDNPAQTGGAVIENYLRQRLGAKIQEKYGDKINEKLNKLGLPGLLGAPAKHVETAPVETNTVTPSETPAAAPVEATPTEAAPAVEPTPAPKTKEEKKREQIEQGVKALQGLLGQ